MTQPAKAAKRGSAAREPARSDAHDSKDGGKTMQNDLPGLFFAKLLPRLTEKDMVNLLTVCKQWRDQMLDNAKDPCLSLQLAASAPMEKSKKGKDAEKAAVKEAMAMSRSQVFLGRVARQCKKLELRLVAGPPQPRIKAGFWSGVPDHKTPDFPSEEVAKQAQDLLHGATFYVNRQLTSITHLSLQGLTIPCLVPGFLASALPNLTHLRLASCIVIVNAPDDPMRFLKPSCKRLTTLRLERPEFKQMGKPEPVRKGVVPYAADPVPAVVQEPQPYGEKPRTVFPANVLLSTPSAAEVLRTHDRLLSDLPSLSAVELWFDPTFSGCAWAAMVLLPSFGGQLRSLTTGRVAGATANKSMVGFCVPTLYTWSQHLTGLTQLDLGATQWVIDNKAAEIIAGTSHTLSDVTVPGFGLHSTVKANWKRVCITCKESEVHMPSLGYLDLPLLEEPICIAPPPNTPPPPVMTGSAAAPLPKLLRLAFNNLTPTFFGDYLEDVLISNLAKAKQTGTVFKPPEGQGGLFVVVESEHASVWDAALELASPHVTALQVDLTLEFNSALLSVIERRVGSTLTHLVFMDVEEVEDEVWSQLTPRLPHLNQITILSPVEQPFSNHVKTLADSLIKPLALITHPYSQGYVKAGHKLVTNQQRSKLLTLQWHTPAP